jgi:hypothetical protein
MDYKEKYEMALEGIQEILGSGEDSIKMSRLQLRLQGIFPELKESEDERIRKAIHIYLDWLDGRNKDYHPKGVYTIKDMIAWLEKQGEKKRDVNIQINTSEYINDMGGNGCCLKNTTQSSAWSEEDKVILNNIIWGVHMKSIKPLDEMDDRSKYKKYEDFLKSLPARFNLQPKEGWSEEDEANLNWFDKFFRAESVIADGKNIPQDKYLWFKNLKGRVQPKQGWKPSKEQMDAVKSAALDVAKFSSRSEQLRLENEPYYKALVSLYNDLKKLREE